MRVTTYSGVLLVQIPADKVKFSYLKYS